MSENEMERFLVKSLIASINKLPKRTLAQLGDKSGRIYMTGELDDPSTWDIGFSVGDPNDGVCHEHIAHLPNVSLGECGEIISSAKEEHEYLVGSADGFVYGLIVAIQRLEAAD